MLFLILIVITLMVQVKEIFLLCELSFYLGAVILLYAQIKYGNPNFINVYLK